YELHEHIARPGAEEQIDNEKYQYKDRQWYRYEKGGDREGQSLAGYLTRLNQIRNQHPSLRWLRNITFHTADDPNIIVYSKRRPLQERTGSAGFDDVVIVVANLDPHSTRESQIHLSMSALGLDHYERFVAHDEIT